ncbi:MAG: glycoside hydrolase family 127 protein [Lentisphaeria bacterium]|nr:glycoside hydrolase family 127 protein [Lentisphaeria bacterium]
MSIYTRPGVTDVRPADPVFARRIQACIDGTIPETIAKTEETGRIDAFRLNWRPGMAKMPHIFWDSDTAKVLEGMAYCLAISPDPELEKKYDEWVDLIVSAQQPDGYQYVFHCGGTGKTLEQPAGLS